MVKKAKDKKLVCFFGFLVFLGFGVFCFVLVFGFFFFFFWSMKLLFVCFFVCLFSLFDVCVKQCPTIDRNFILLSCSNKKKVVF